MYVYIYDICVINMQDINLPVTFPKASTLPTEMHLAN